MEFTRLALWLQAIVVLASTAAYASIAQCDGYETAPLQFLGGTFPEEIVLPSTVYADIYVRIFEELPEENLLFDLDLIQVSDIPLIVPCVETGDGGEIGSCKYDICPIIEGPLSESWCGQFPEGQECGCPLSPGDYNLTDIALDIPDFGATFGELLVGSYEARGVLITEDPIREYGCVEFTFSFVIEE